MSSDAADALDAVPRSGRRAEQTCAKTVRPDTELWAALDEMDRDGVNQLPVMVNGQMLGMLSREDVVTFLQALRELGT